MHHSLRHNLEIISARKEAFENGKTIAQTEKVKIFNEGYSHGKLDTLVTLRTKVHEIAAASPANRNESRYENYVIMLSDVENVIAEILEGK